MPTTSAPTPTFDRALSIVLKLEGGWWPGGEGDPNPTMYGVTQRTYDAYRRSVGLPLASVRWITRPELEDIYEDGFWIPAGCDSLPWGLCAVAFDLAVNSGIPRARKLLAEADGDVERLFQLRQQFYDRLVERRPETARFAKGWRNRLTRLRKEIQRA